MSVQISRMLVEVCVTDVTARMAVTRTTSSSKKARLHGHHTTQGVRRPTQQLLNAAGIHAHRGKEEQRQRERVAGEFFLCRSLNIT